MLENFNISREDKEKVSVLKMEGYLDANTIGEFERSLEHLMDQKRYNIVTDLSGLNYISSAGLGVYMGFIEDVRAEKGDIKLCCLSDKIFKVFDLLGFPALFDILPSIESCMESFNIEDGK